MIKQISWRDLRLTAQEAQALGKLKEKATLQSCPTRTV
jgi:hypothetical protein